MKKIFSYKNVFMLGAAIWGLACTSCSDDDEPMGPIQMTSITTIADMKTPIDEAALGDFIAIHGSGLDVHNIDSIFFDDVKVDMGEVYSENSVLFMKIPVKMALKKNDKLTIYNKVGCYEIPFKTNAPNLKLTRMFNEYTHPGDTIMIYGEFFDLYQIDSLNAVVDFNGKESKVIRSGNNYLTTRVPDDVEKNIKVKLKGTKFGVEAVCPGRYYDNEFMIMDFDQALPDDRYMKYVVTDVNDKNRLSGNYLHINDKSEWSGWWYIAERGDIPYTPDMLDLEKCKDYVVKCEFFSANQFIKDKIKFHIYSYWNAPPMVWEATDFNVQNFNRWETITLPWSVVVPGDYSSFNIRLEIDQSLARNFAFDNIRICKKGD